MAKGPAINSPTSVMKDRSTPIKNNASPSTGRAVVESQTADTNGAKRARRRQKGGARGFIMREKREKERRNMSFGATPLVTHFKGKRMECASEGQSSEGG